MGALAALQHEPFEPRGLPGVPQLQYVDLVGPGVPSGRLQELAALHDRHFPEYAHVQDELLADAAGPGPYPGVVVHQVLILRDMQPVGLTIFHSNTRRGVGLVHFLAVASDARADLGQHWLVHLNALWVTTALRDHEAAGTNIFALAAEVPGCHLAKWQRVGWQYPRRDYCEPRLGMCWATAGPAVPIPQNLIVFAMGHPGQHRTDQLADRSVMAFLVDHYRLPLDHALVSRALVRHPHNRVHAFLPAQPPPVESGAGRGTGARNQRVGHPAVDRLGNRQVR